MVRKQRVSTVIPHITRVFFSPFFLLFRSNIFYRACVDIPRGTELLVWYNDSYTSFFGIPLQCIAQDENCEFVLYFHIHNPEFVFRI